jgi:protein-tyrosine phosphatase
MASSGPKTAAFDRHIVLEGAVNFRDLGGYPAGDGRTVRWRSLFRADGLSHLTRPDRAIVRQLGIATVIDLRSRSEVDAGRFPVDDIPVGFHHVPLVTELPDAELFQKVPGFVAAHYQDIARQSGAQVATALGIVAERHAHPVIVHCTAGKDRTGVLVAVILALLGVDDETIAADYALSAAAMTALRARLLERNPSWTELIETVGDVMFSATPDNITRLLGSLRGEYGSIEAYAAAHGAGETVVAGLRDALLEGG